MTASIQENRDQSVGVSGASSLREDRAGHEPSQSSLSRPVGDHPIARLAPGPWFKSAISVEDVYGRAVAICHPDIKRPPVESLERMHACARFIAAAPEVRDALQSLCAVIRAAGVHNLSNGVQLGPVVWAVKCSDALEAADAALERALGQ